MTKPAIAWPSRKNRRLPLLVLYIGALFILAALGVAAGRGLRRFSPPAEPAGSHVLAGTTTEAPTQVSSPTPTDTPSLTPSPSPTDTPSPTATRPDDTAPPTATPSPSATSTLTPTPTPTYTPGPTPDGVEREARVPILMYHYISTPPPGADAIRRDLSIAPDLFESHLRYLQEAGYRSISLRDLVYHLTLGWPLPPKPIILTFDDGYRDNYENAFPLLKKYGFRGTFFLVTDFIDEGRAAYMTWPQIKEMYQAGMEFGAHSRNHPDLRGKPLDYLVWQSLGPSETIEYNLGERPRFYSYPSGQYDKKAIEVIRSAGYWAGLTIHQGMTHSSQRLFELQRIRVRGSHSAEDLATLLNLDW